MPPLPHKRFNESFKSATLSDTDRESQHLRCSGPPGNETLLILSWIEWERPLIRSALQFLPSRLITKAQQTEYGLRCKGHEGTDAKRSSNVVYNIWSHFSLQKCVLSLSFVFLSLSPRFVVFPWHELRSKSIRSLDPLRIEFRLVVPHRSEPNTHIIPNFGKDYEMVDARLGVWARLVTIFATRRFMNWRALSSYGMDYPNVPVLNKGSIPSWLKKCILRQFQSLESGLQTFTIILHQKTYW